MKNLLLSLSFILLFSGCEFESPFKPSKDEIALKNKQLDANIANENEKLKIQKEIELAKIQSTIEKEKIVSKNKEQDNQYKISMLKTQQDLQVQQYFFIILALIAVITAIAGFIYFNNRRKDKLKAYEDNLEKYFRNKENDAKVKITNRILDMIEDGHLSEKQENKLIESIHGSSKKSSKKLAKLQKDEDIVDLEVIEDEKKETK